MKMQYTVSTLSQNLSRGNSAPDGGIARNRKRLATRVAAAAAILFLVPGVFSSCAKIGGRTGIPDSAGTSSTGAKAAAITSGIIPSSTALPAGSSSADSPTISPSSKAPAIPTSRREASSRVESRNAPAAPLRQSSPPARPVTAPIVYTKYFPVIMYHSIKYEKNNPVRIAPQNFERQLAWLSQNGYTTLTADKAYSYYENDRGFPKKSVLLTFDDGYSDNYTTVFPLLKKYKMTATIFIISGDVGKSGYLSRAQILEMSKWGIEIECHTVTHPYLAKLNYSDQIYQLKTCKGYLEALTGKPVCYIAYPYGSYSAITIKAARELGFKMAFKMSGGKMTCYSGAFTLPRIFVNGSFREFTEKI